MSSISGKLKRTLNGSNIQEVLMMTITKPTAYDYKNCQSLFGYAAQVHERSGGICQLCGAGRERLNFDLWRQLTVEHLIGESQDGYLKAINQALAERYPDMDSDERRELAIRIDQANTVTACSFCNATTSRARADISMASAIATAPDGPPDVIYEHVTSDLDSILEAKKADVAWKLASVRAQFDKAVAPRLGQVRDATARV
jgi:hypothetical protein